MRFVAPVALLILISTGCASRRELFSAAPRPPARSAGPADTSRGDRAVERVKESIKSLRHEVSKRRPGAASSLADLPPIPLVKPLAQRIVGTSGAWSVVQTTQTTPPSLHTSERRHGGTWPDRAHLNRGPIWLLLTAAAVLVAAILTLRAQRSRHRFHG